MSSARILQQEQFHPLVRAQLQDLVTRRPPNHYELFQLTQASSSARTHNGPCDKMQVLVPHCKTLLRWDVLYDSQDWTAVPDLIFVNSHQFEPQLDLLKALHDWNAADPSCLYRLLCDVLQQFLLYQTELVRRLGNERINVEMDSLLTSELLSKTVQVYVERGIASGSASGASGASGLSGGASGGSGANSGTGPGASSSLSSSIHFAEASLGPDNANTLAHPSAVSKIKVHFFLSVPVDISKLAASGSAPGQGLAAQRGGANVISVFILANYLFLDGRRQSFSSSAADMQVESTIDLPGALTRPDVAQYFKFPPFTASTLVLDYALHVLESIQRAIDTHSDKVQKRVEYLAAFLNAFGQAVVEFNMSEGCSMVSFCAEFQNHVFFVHIDLGPQFPAEPPTITLVSSLFEKNDVPFKQVHRDYPYSPRWSAEEKVNRAKIFLGEQAKVFFQDAKATLQ